MSKDDDRGRTVWNVVWAIGVLGSILAVTMRHCTGADVRYISFDEAMRLAADEAHRKAGDANLVELDLEGVAPDGRIDLRHPPTFHFIASSLDGSHPKCQLEVRVRAVDYVVLGSRAPFAYFAVRDGCDAHALPAPACSPAAIWERAIHDGAQRAGTANLSYGPERTWTFAIGDNERTYPDDCGPAKRE